MGVDGARGGRADRRPRLGPDEGAPLRPPALGRDARSTRASPRPPRSSRSRPAGATRSTSSRRASSARRARWCRRSSTAPSTSSRGARLPLATSTAAVALRGAVPRARLRPRAQDAGVAVWARSSSASSRSDRNMVHVGIFYYGVRHFTTKPSALKTAADVKGLKIRVPEAPLFLAMIRALEATPTPMTLRRGLPRLQTGVADGQENPLPTINNNKFYEVQKYLNLTATSSCRILIMVNKKAWDAMTDADKAAVSRPSPKAARSTTGSPAPTRRGSAILKAKGMTIVQLRPRVVPPGDDLGRIQVGENDWVARARSRRCRRSVVGWGRSWRCVSLAASPPSRAPSRSASPGSLRDPRQALLSAVRGEPRRPLPRRPPRDAVPPGLHALRHSRPRRRGPRRRRAICTSTSSSSASSAASPTRTHVGIDFLVLDAAARGRGSWSPRRQSVLLLVLATSFCWGIARDAAPPQHPAGRARQSRTPGSTS